MGVRQRTFGPSGGNLASKPVSRQTPSRFGPSHCGQSSARTAVVVRNRAKIMIDRIDIRFTPRDRIGDAVAITIDAGEGKSNGGKEKLGGLAGGGGSCQAE